MYMYVSINEIDYIYNFFLINNLIISSYIIVTVDIVLIDIYIQNIVEISMIRNRIDWNGLYIVFQQNLLIFIIAYYKLDCLFWKKFFFHFLCPEIFFYRLTKFDKVYLQLICFTCLNYMM